MNPRSERRASRQSSYASNARSLTLWVETSVVLLLIAGPTLAGVACWVFWGDEYLLYDKQHLYLDAQTSTTFGIKLLESMVTKLRLVPIILFVIWRSGDAWSRFGLVKPKWQRDVLIGAGLSLLVVVTDQMVRPLFHSSHTFTWWNLLPASNPPSRTLLLIAANCATGFSEELGVRAYLIPRLEELLGATWKAVLLSSVIFALLHLYKGVPGMVHSLLAGLIWGVGFCLTRRIWPVAISHALTDFIVVSHMNSLVGL